MDVAGVAFLILLFLSLVSALVGVVLDQLLVGEDNDDDTYYIITSTEVDGKIKIGFSFDESHSDLCDDSNEDFCELEWRGIVWISCNSAGLLFGVLAFISACLLECNKVACCLSTKIGGLVLCLLSFLCFLSAVLVWWIENPLLGEESGAGELIEGISFWLVSSGGIVCFICMFAFACVWRDAGGPRFLSSVHFVGSFNPGDSSWRKKPTPKASKNETIGVEITQGKGSSFGAFDKVQPAAHAAKGPTGYSVSGAGSSARGSSGSPDVGGFSTYHGRGGKRLKGY